MRIGIDGNSLKKNQAGTGRYSRNLIQALKDISRDDDFVYFFSRRSPAQDSGQKHGPLRRILRGLGDFLWTQLYLPFHLRKKNIDFFFAPSYIAPIILHCPFFVVIYDTTFKLYPQKADKLFRLYLNFLMPAVLRKASKIITLSTNSKMDIIKYFQVPEEKIEVIYGAADLSFQIADNDATRTKIRERFHLPEKYILNVNVLEPRKNIETLLLAYDRIKKAHDPPCKLVIVGGRGWGYKSIFQTVSDLRLEKDVVFTGFVPDEVLNYLYNMAEVFVFPSLYEGYGLPVIEAMACGCPVISSNKASLPEVVGDSGLLVDPEDIEAMAAAIWKVISNPRLNQDLRKRSLERSKHFSWENSGQKLKTLINQTMSKNGR